MVFTLHMFGSLTFGSENLSGSHPTNQEVVSFSRFFFGVIKITSRRKAIMSKLGQFCLKIVLHFARETQGNILLVIGLVFSKLPR